MGFVELANRANFKGMTESATRHGATGDLMLHYVKTRPRRLFSLFNEWVIDGFFGEASRLAFGNSAGFRNNVGPLLNGAMSGNRGGRKMLPEVERLERDGYVLCQASYESKMIGDVIAKYQRAIADAEHARPNSKYSIELKDAMKSIPEFSSLLNTHVREMLRGYFRSPFRVVETQAFRTYPIPEADREKEAYSNFWHCDGYPASWLKVYVFLSDWEPTSGGTEILPIQSTKKVMRSGYINRYFSLCGTERLDQLTATHATAMGSAGSVFVFNPQRCLHRAGIPKDGRHRDAMMFFVAGASDSSAEAAAGANQAA